jgi:enamine deaminase RidA (YjgF/YER057c/UK114 family)
MNDQHQANEERRRRGFLKATVAGMAGGSLAALSASSAGDAAEPPAKPLRQGLSPSGLPPADSGYSQGVMARAGELLFISGQIPDDRSAPMETQIRQTLEKIGQVLESAGASFENVVFLRGYFVHLLRDLPIYRGLRKDFLVEPYPASTCVGVTELAVPGLEVEIEAIAVL